MKHPLSGVAGLSLAMTSILLPVVACGGVDDGVGGATIQSKRRAAEEAERSANPPSDDLTELGDLDEEPEPPAQPTTNVITGPAPAQQEGDIFSSGAASTNTGSSSTGSSSTGSSSTGSSGTGSSGTGSSSTGSSGTGSNGTAFGATGTSTSGTSANAVASSCPTVQPLVGDTCSGSNVVCTYSNNTNSVLCTCGSAIWNCVVANRAAASTPSTPAGSGGGSSTAGTNPNSLSLPFDYSNSGSFNPSSSNNPFTNPAFQFDPSAGFQQFNAGNTGTQTETSGSIVGTPIDSSNTDPSIVGTPIDASGADTEPAATETDPAEEDPSSAVQIEPRT